MCGRVSIFILVWENSIREINLKRKNRHKKNEIQNTTTRGQFYKLIYALRQTIWALRPTFEKLFTSAKVWRKVQKIAVGRKTVYEIGPKSQRKFQN